MSQQHRKYFITNLQQQFQIRYGGIAGNNTMLAGNHNLPLSQLLNTDVTFHMPELGNPD